MMRATTMRVVNGYQSAMCGQQVGRQKGGHITRPGPVLFKRSEEDKVMYVLRIEKIQRTPALALAPKLLILTELFKT